MNRLLCIVIAASAGLVPCGHGAISVTATGAGPFGFETTPNAGEFSTGILLGASYAFSTPDQLDAAVATLAASNIALTLPTTGTFPPSAYALGFRHNVTGLLLQSRPTDGWTNAACLLLATVQNDSGGPIAAFALSYDFNLYYPRTFQLELPGFRVYYSATGTPGSWQVIPGLSGTETIGRMSATIAPPTLWTPGQRFYLLWVDDNAQWATDPAYTIDNLAIEPLVSLRAQPADGGLLLSWPDYATGFTVETTSALGSAAAWSPLGGTVIVTNGWNTVSFATTGDLRFFRLRKP